MSISDRMNLALAKYSDVALALGVVVIISLLIFRIQPWMMDIFLAINIGASVLILLTALYIPDAMRLPSFPTLLLLTTLYRLALNVTSTRLILLEANAGEIISAFGNFVVAGNFVVGGVVFIILTLIQFIVIAKGSERVAEVAARFTLDAMPGKQMSIDADLRAGMITPEVAREKRQGLERESKLYGAMDGAMKFVKGDAIAGIIIALVNIVGGIIIGVVQMNMPIGEAAQTFSLLTIGDGLVSQIPALLICVSAGFVVTRVSSSSGGPQQPHMAKDIVDQILANPKAIAVVSIILFLTGFVPGFPMYVFFLLAAFAGLLGFPQVFKRMPAVAGVGVPAGATGIGTTPGSGQPGAAGAGAAEEAERPALPRRLYPLPIVLEIGQELEPLFTQDGKEKPELRRQLEESIRGQLSEDLGLPYPPIRLQIDNPHLRPTEYSILIFDAPVARGMMSPNQALALCDLSTAESHKLAAQPMRIPWSRAEASLIPADQTPQASAAGVRVLPPDRVILNHLLVTLRRQADQFLGIQEVSGLIERMKTERPDLIKAVIPVQLTIQQVTEVLRTLLRERTPIRDLRAILESLAKHSPQQKNPVALAELVRTDLKRLLCARYTANGALDYYSLQPDIERMIQEATVETAAGPQVALSYADQRRIVEAMQAAIDPRRHLASDPVVITVIPSVRQYLRSAMEHIMPEVVFLSFNELAPECAPNQIGLISLKEGEE